MLTYTKMAKEGPSSVHPFPYDYSKQAFQQELEYILVTQYLYDRTAKKEGSEENITEIGGENISYLINYADYARSRVVKINSKDRLCRVFRVRHDDGSDFVAKLVPTPDEIFNILAEIHMFKPHLLESHKDLENVSNIHVEKPLLHLFMKSCGTCNLKRYIWQPLREYSTTGEVGLISVVPVEEEFKYILMYVERNTNYVLLRPIKNKSCNEIALELMNIFSDFGAPVYLNVTQKKLFSNALDILDLLELPWVKPSLLLKTPLHKLEKLTLRARALLKDWMKNSECKNWIIGAHIIQWILNSNKVVDTYIRSRIVNGIIDSPYHALFGMLPPKRRLHFNTDVGTKTEHPQETQHTSKDSLLNCSQCKQKIYKVYYCTNCTAPCHFTCCKRLYINDDLGGFVLISKCNSCAVKH